MRYWARRVRVEQDENQEQSQRWQRNVACISSLRAILVAAIEARSGRITKLQPEYTTQMCSGCGHVEAFDAKREVIHTWECGHTHDQDENAARNLMRAASGSGVVDGAPALAMA